MTETSNNSETVKQKRSNYYPDSSKQYYARPEIQEKKKAYEKEYTARPEFKEMKKEYNKRYQARVKVRRQQEKQLLEELMQKVSNLDKLD
jgi:hypothetical protein